MEDCNAPAILILIIHTRRKISIKNMNYIIMKKFFRMFHVINAATGNYILTAGEFLIEIKKPDVVLIRLILNKTVLIFSLLLVYFIRVICLV